LKICVTLFTLRGALWMQALCAGPMGWNCRLRDFMNLLSAR
jgi:hypothetical protein